MIEDVISDGVTTGVHRHSPGASHDVGKNPTTLPASTLRNRTNAPPPTFFFHILSPPPRFV